MFIVAGENPQHPPLNDNPALKGSMYVANQNFKTGCFAFWGGGHVTVGISLLFLQYYCLCLYHCRSFNPSFMSLNNNESSFHQKIKLHILCYNKTEDKKLW